MKTFGKILALVLAGLMAAALAGCGGAKDEMIIGVTLNPPMNYQDAKGNWTLGFDTEFAIAVCDILGVKAKFVEIDWTAKETELKGRTIDAVWNGMTITPERAEEMDISIPYMNNRPVIVVRAADKEKYQDATDLSGVALVAEGGSTLEECVKAQPIFANANFTPVEKQVVGMMEVLAGTADMTVVDGTLAADQIKAGSDFADLAVIDKNFPSEEYGIAFLKGRTGDDTDPFDNILEKVNDAILKLRADGTLQKLADKYGLGDLLIK